MGNAEKTWAVSAAVIEHHMNKMNRRRLCTAVYTELSCLFIQLLSALGQIPLNAGPCPAALMANSTGINMYAIRVLSPVMFSALL